MSKEMHKKSELNVMYLNGNYYIYTRTWVDGNLFVNFERLNK